MILKMMGDLDMGRGVWKYFIGFVLIVPALMIVAIYLYFQFSPLYSRLKVDTSLAEHGAIEGVVMVQAYVHRNENAYHIPVAGQLRWNVQEGQRVARNQKLADVIISDEDQSLVLQQQLINMRLDTLAQGGDLSTYSNEALGEIDRQMKFLLSDIGYNIKNRQYELAFQNQHLLNEMTAQKQLVSVHQQLPDMSKEELEAQKAMIEGRLNNITHEIRAENAGFFAFGSDGLENTLGLQPDEEDVTKALHILGLDLPQELEDTDATYFRIIEDHRWYLLLPLDVRIAKNYDEGQRILLRTTDTNQEVRGRILKYFFSDGNDEAIFLVELNHFVEQWQNLRVVHVNVIYQRQEGLLVPVDAVMDEPDGSKSVYLVDVNGYAVKKRVHELTRNDFTAVLREGMITIQSNDVEAGEVQIESIRQYDEIIANPEMVAEGQKVR